MAQMNEKEADSSPNSQHVKYHEVCIKEDQEEMNSHSPLSLLHLPPPPGVLSASQRSLGSLTFSMAPSFSSFNFFSESTFNMGGRKCNGILLQGPRRVLKLCIIGMLLPALFICIPLYVRLVIYPPLHFMMASTDQRLLDYSSSSVWCQSQTAQMNGTFNAFMMDEKPPFQRRMSVYSMVQHLVLKDDVKEYWGFFLQRGSLVAIDLCNKYDGGMLMIMKGAHNLKKCAWIGEEDSAEQDEDHQEDSNESGIMDFHRDAHIAPDEILMEVDGKPLGELEAELTKIKDELSPHENNFTSEERKDEIDHFVKRLLELGKNPTELIDSIKNQIPQGIYNNIKNNNFSKSNDDHPIKNDSTTTRLTTTNGSSRIDRLKRSLIREDDYHGEAEILDNQQEAIQTIVFPSSNNNSYEVSNETKEAFLSLFDLPSGLTYDRGNFDQKYNHDTSNEEHRSSFSSSEEALTKCDGVIGVMPLYPSRKCDSEKDSHYNKVKYRIPSTGTYYFVFSSDNEVFESSIYFNLTLHRVVFNTNFARDECINKTDCSLALSFWSHDQAVIEIPQHDWNAAYDLEIKCQPRVAVYLVFIFLIPILILFCAYQ